LSLTDWQCELHYAMKVHIDELPRISNTDTSSICIIYDLSIHTVISHTKKTLVERLRFQYWLI